MLHVNRNDAWLRWKRPMWWKSCWKEGNHSMIEAEGTDKRRHESNEEHDKRWSQICEMRVNRHRTINLITFLEENKCWFHFLDQFDPLTSKLCDNLLVRSKTLRRPVNHIVTRPIHCSIFDCWYEKECESMKSEFLFSQLDDEQDKEWSQTTTFKFRRHEISNWTSRA